MKRLYILIPIFFVCSCGTYINHDNLANFQMAEISIPNSKLDELMNREITKEEVDGIIEKYSKTKEPKNSEAPPYENYFVCAGVYFDPSYSLENASKFKLIGVTEEWIPVRGKKTKVLYFRAVK